MFDILTDIWAHPGAVHAPILPFDITDLSAADADSTVSNLHKHGYDTLMLTCKAFASLCEGVLEAIFAACAKRFMLVFVDESVITSVTFCTDDAFCAYNPMLSSHVLSLVPDGDEPSGGELVATAYIKLEGDKLCDVRESLTDADDASSYVKYRFVMESRDGIDILCPETCEMLIYSAYETFMADYKEASAGTLAGVVTGRLSEYNSDTVFWSYDMLADFKAVGGDVKMLAALLIKGDKRSEKEGMRLYNKALSARLESSFCRPVSEWCGRNSLAFMGEAPRRFASNCGRRFTIPVWSREGYPDNCESCHDIISGVRHLGDIARGEGFTGSAYKAVSTDADSLIRELITAFMGSAALVILPEAFADSARLESVGILREDMRRICTFIKRRSTFGTSCGSKTPVAVLCDDDFIPYQGAEKLRCLGVSFNFVSRSQITERGRVHHGELLIDKFRYSVLLIDQRIRLDVSEVMKLGEFASYGGTMYRGGAFGDFAKKNIEVSPFMSDASSKVLVYETEKCSCPFVMLCNNTDKTVRISGAFCEHQGYVLDASNGKKHPVSQDSELRILPGDMMTIAYDPSGETALVEPDVPVSEIIALGEGKNTFELADSIGLRAFIELDCVSGFFADVSVNGKELHRILFPPYTAEVTSMLCSGENELTIYSDGTVSGAVLRIFSKEI